MKEQYVLTLKAEDRPGLLHLVTGMIEKRKMKINSLSLAATDISDITLITVEVVGTEGEIAILALKLENIIEIFAVEVAKYNQALCLRAAYFKIDSAFFEGVKASTLSKYSTTIIKTYPGALLLAQYGTDAAVLSLYNELDGPHLLGFSQTGLIADCGLMAENEDVVRIIGLAA
ncbi:hypothetical protein HQ865_23510 [Mucilaginibacter mali]|uniref:ACT domain-containing protein n=1 Tax=Mucilaginibacter mali TaxID=2740462 RepID=A0A7D4PXP1_9SPHI|nr:hypothetical protein [Mucilaginibacter mali]QKJ32603.1 hypothetical protein HQ865_23510 [Mucilaginibacter mali]